MEQIKDIKEAVSLYNKGLSEITGNIDNWKELLKFQSKFYKYKFHEILLLYSQDKDITACATFDEWKKIGRYVKPYSKSLKTIYSEKGKLYLKSVFDIKDTNSKYNVDFKLWETNEREAFEILSNNLNITLDYIDNLRDLIILHLNNIINDDNFYNVLELEREQAYSEEFLNCFIESVTSVVLNRCGIEYEANLKDFESINNNKVLKSLGYIVNKCSYDLLKVIELEIKKSLEKSELEELEYERNNINQNEQNVGRNETSKVSGINNGRNIQRPNGDIFGRNIESRTTNRRTIKKAVSKAGFRRVYSTSSIRKYDTNIKNGKHKQYDRRKSKSNLEYDEGVVQTTLFNLFEDKSKLKEKTPTEVTFSGYKVGDLVYLNSGEPQYIREINTEKNYVLLTLNINTNAVLQKISIPEFEEQFYNSNNNEIIEENKASDLERLSNITEINPLNENEENKIYTPISPIFKIPDNLKGESIGLKKKYEENIEAIKLLRQLENEDREATESEKLILAKYNGWGGLAKAFEENSNEYEELKELLTDEEFSSGRESALTSFYTEPYIIDFMYKAVERFGLKGKCQILDPCAGVGNFIRKIT